MCYWFLKKKTTSRKFFFWFTRRGRELTQIACFFHVWLLLDVRDLFFSLMGFLCDVVLWSKMERKMSWVNGMDRASRACYVTAVEFCTVNSDESKGLRTRCRSDTYFFSHVIHNSTKNKNWKHQRRSRNDVWCEGKESTRQITSTLKRQYIPLLDAISVLQ